MSEPALRLLEDDGTPEEIARLREIIADLQRQVASLKRMLQAAFDEAKIKDDTIAKYHRENTGLKTRLIRQEKQDAQDEVVSAVFDFWQLMTVHPRAKLGAARTKAINGRIREGATPRDFFKAIVGAAYDSYVHPETGKRYDDLELICRNESNLEARIERFYLVPDVRQMVGDAGAIDAARALMDLERARRADA